MILLPATVDWADEETLIYVFTHELAHIRRLDALWKPLLAAVACLHWFDPLVWLMLALAGRDMELACDEAVVRALGREARKGYARALLTMEERRGGLAAASYFSKNATEERIRSIMKIRPRSFLSIFLAFALVLTVGGALATTAGAAETDSDVLYAELIPGRCGTYDGYFELDREEFEELCAQEEPRWWSYEDYAEEALRLKAEAAGLTGATVQYPDGTAIYWTQERVDAYGARYDAVLGAIGQGLRLSRTPDCRLAEDPSGGELIAMLLPPAAEDREAPADTEAPVMYPSAVISSSDGTETPAMYSGNVISSSDGTVYVFTEDGEPVSMTQQEYKVLFDIPEPEAEVEWWTAEEYAAWLEQEKKDLQDSLGQRAWTNSDGWFIWTQEKIDEAIEMYEQVLADIENGLLVSKPMAGGALLYEGADTAVQYSGSDAFRGYTYVFNDGDEWIQLGPFDTEEELLDALTDEVNARVADGRLSEEAAQDILDGYDPAPGAAQIFTPGGEVTYSSDSEGQEVAEEELYSTQTVLTDASQAALDELDDAIEPYLPFGLRCGYDVPTGELTLYWNGRQVRGLYDSTAGVWITAHSGDGTWPEDTPEVMAVYEGGKLTGLRLATEEEQEQWDRLRAVSGLSGSPASDAPPPEPETENSALRAGEDVTAGAQFFSAGAADRDVYGSLEAGMEVTVTTLSAAPGNTVSVGLLTRTDAKLEVILRRGDAELTRDVELKADQPQTVALYPGAAGEYDLCLKNTGGCAAEFTASCLVT